MKGVNEKSRLLSTTSIQVSVDVPREPFKTSQTKSSVAKKATNSIGFTANLLMVVSFIEGFAKKYISDSIRNRFDFLFSNTSFLSMFSFGHIFSFFSNRSLRNDIQALKDKILFSAQTTNQNPEEIEKYENNLGVTSSKKSLALQLIIPLIFAIIHRTMSIVDEESEYEYSKEMSYLSGIYGSAILSALTGPILQFYISLNLYERLSFLTEMYNQMNENYIKKSMEKEDESHEQDEDDSKEELARSKRIIDGLQRQIQDAENQLSKQEEEIKKLNDSQREVQEENASLQVSVKEKDEKIQKKDEEIQKKEKQLSKQEEEIKKQSGKLQTLTSEKKTLANLLTLERSRYTTNNTTSTQPSNNSNQQKPSIDLRKSMP